MRHQPTGPNPSGLCQCGCGQSAPLARDTVVSRGIVKGQPQLYIFGHYRPMVGDPRYLRHTFDSYDVMDCGYATSCWVFRGKRRNNGYGQMTMPDGRQRMAHRAFYERHKGTIPEGLVLDHLCRNHACVNPDHLEPVTSRINTLRGVGTSAANAIKTHCKRGHEFTPENTYVYPTKWGTGRQCRACIRMRGRKTDAKRRAKP